MIRLLMIAVWIGLLPCGCASWKEHEVSVPKLPRNQMSQDSVGLEVATVTVDLQQPDALTVILRQLDEQVMPAEQRRRLAGNGLRAGILGSQLPDEVNVLLLEAAERRMRPTAQSLLEGFDQQRFVQCREGKSYPISIWPAVESLSVPHATDETESSTTYRDAMCVVEMKCEHLGVQGAKLHFSPKIDHGPLKQQYGMQDGSIHFEAKRSRKEFADLAMELALQPGETLLITCTPNAKGNSLGSRFFQRKLMDDDKRLAAANEIKAMMMSADIEREDIPSLEEMDISTVKQKLLLVRLAQTQIADVFVEEIEERLTTVED